MLFSPGKSRRKACPRRLMSFQASRKASSGLSCLSCLSCPSRARHPRSGHQPCRGGVPSSSPSPPLSTSLECGRGRGCLRSTCLFHERAGEGRRCVRKSEGVLTSSLLFLFLSTRASAEGKEKQKEEKKKKKGKKTSFGRFLFPDPTCAVPDALLKTARSSVCGAVLSFFFT